MSSIADDKKSLNIYAQTLITDIKNDLCTNMSSTHQVNVPSTSLSKLVALRYTLNELLNEFNEDNHSIKFGTSDLSNNMVSINSVTVNIKLNEADRLCQERIESLINNDVDVQPKPVAKKKKPQP